MPAWKILLPCWWGWTLHKTSAAHNTRVQAVAAMLRLYLWCRHHLQQPIGTTRNQEFPPPPSQAMHAGTCSRLQANFPYEGRCLRMPATESCMRSLACCKVPASSPPVQARVVVGWDLQFPQLACRGLGLAATCRQLEEGVVTGQVASLCCKRLAWHAQLRVLHTVCVERSRTT